MVLTYLVMAVLMSRGRLAKTWYQIAVFSVACPADSKLTFSARCHITRLFCVFVWKPICCLKNHHKIFLREKESLVKHFKIWMLVVDWLNFRGRNSQTIDRVRKQWNDNQNCRFFSEVVQSWYFQQKQQKKSNK